MKQELIDAAVDLSNGHPRYYRYYVGEIRWRKKDGDLPAAVLLSIPGYVVDLAGHYWGPWVRDELSNLCGGKCLRFDALWPAF